MVGIFGFVFGHDEMKVMMDSNLIELELGSGIFVILYTPYIFKSCRFNGTIRDSTFNIYTVHGQTAM